MITKGARVLNKQIQKDWLNIFYFCVLLIIGASVMIGLVVLLTLAGDYDLSLTMIPKF